MTSPAIAGCEGGERRAGAGALGRVGSMGSPFCGFVFEMDASEERTETSGLLDLRLGPAVADWIRIVQLISLIHHRSVENLARVKKILHQFFLQVQLSKTFKEDREQEDDEGSGRGAGTLKEDAGGNHGTACSTISKDLTAFGAKSRRASNSSRLVSTSKDRLDTERKLPLMKVDDLTTISIMARISGSPGACSRGRRMWSSKGLSRGAVTKSYI
jgi:hypothetical protein